MEYRRDDHPELLANKFQEFRRDGKYCDFELTCGGPVLTVHRLVLAAASPVFEATLNAGCKNFRLDFLEPDLLEALVDFMYTGTISVDTTKVQDLMCAANFLELDDLVTACADHLMSQLQPSNALSLFRSAQECNQSALIKKASLCYWEYQRKEFLGLPLELLLEMLSSSVDRDNRNECLRVCLEWLQHESRRAHLCDTLLTAINWRDLKLLGGKLNNVRDQQLAKGLVGFMVLLEPTIAHRTLYVVGGRLLLPGEVVEVTATGLKYDTSTRTWSAVASMNVPRAGHGLAVSMDHLYAIGGEDEDVTLASAEVYDPANDAWSSLPPMREARSHFGVAALYDRLYVFGGERDGRLISSIEEYSLHNREWNVVGEMPEPRSQMSAVTYKGAIYLVGGVVRTALGGRVPSPDLLCYRAYASGYFPPRSRIFWRHRHRFPAGNVSLRVSRKASMGRARSGHIAVVESWRGCLYVFGGITEDDNSRSMERYDFVTNQWENLEDMLEPRCALAASATLDELVVAGGGLHWTYGLTDHVELYDLCERRWTPQRPLPQPRSGAGVVSISSVDEPLQRRQVWRQDEDSD